jgi:hypothetical protein
MNEIKKCFYFFSVLTILFFLPNLILSQGKYRQTEESTVYDVVDPKTMEIDADFYMEHYVANTSANVKKARVNVQSDLKYFNAPNLTFRYGLIKNLELQLITGYTGVLTKGNVTIKTKKDRIINTDKNVTGLNALGLGIKAGLMSNRKARPSLAFTGIVTLPNIGNPLFTPNTVGAEIDLDFYNSLSDYVDVAYDIGTVWSGYKEDPNNSYSYGISPGYTFSDNFGLYLDFNGIMEKGYSSDNRFDVDLSFTLSDYITLDAYAGTSFNIKRFYFIGSTLTATIPF